MGRLQPEDVKVKIPALIHLTRLGYRYLPRAGVHRDHETNILPEDLQAAAERINGISLSESVFGDLLSDIRQSLALEDLGSCFYDGLRNSWHGIRLIDFSHPEKNICRVMTELPCINGKNHFRPDITLFINGLPLAFIEVKNQGPGDGMRFEYNRMIRRFRNPHLRRFINETQIMVFSNDTEYDEEDLIPRKGAFYATSAYDDLVFHRFKEAECQIFRQIAPADSEEIALILRDNGMEDQTSLSDFPSSLSPDTPTHRLLTSLFHASRILFFLRYGITYLEKLEEDGQRRIHKQIMRYPQLFAVRFLEHQLRNGQPGGIWSVSESSRVALAAVQIRYLIDYYAEKNITVRFFYLTDDPGRTGRIRDAFLSRRFCVREITTKSGFLKTMPQEQTRILSSEPLILLACVHEYADFPFPHTGRHSGQNIWFWDGADDRYEISESFPDRIHAADPQAVLILFSSPGRE